MEVEGQFWSGMGLMAKEGTCGGGSASCRQFLGPRKKEECDEVRRSGRRSVVAAFQGR